MTKEILDFIVSHKAHIATTVSGGGAAHLIHVIGPWLKANGGIPGAFHTYLFPKNPSIVKTNVTVIQNPTVKESLTAQLSPAAPSETIQPK